MSAKDRRSVPVTIYIPTDDLAALRAHRDRTGVPVAAFVRRAVTARLHSATPERKARTPAPPPPAPPPLLAWLRDVLAAGTIEPGSGAPPAWRAFYTTAELHGSFDRWRRARTFERPMAANIQARHLRRLFGPSRRTPAGCGGARGRARGFWLGPLADARARFRDATGIAVSAAHGEERADSDVSDLLA